MKFLKHFQGLIIGFAMAIFFVIFVSVIQTEAQSTEASLTKRNRGGAVTVDVVYMNPIEKYQKGRLVFKIEMNTHSVDLNAYQIEKNSFLKNDNGEETMAIAWEQPSGDGHHRSGLLVFSDTHDSGAFVVTRETRFIKLIIKGLAGIEERVFLWDLN